MSFFDTMSEKTLVIGGAAIALTLAAAVSYHMDKKKAKEEEHEYPDEDVFDPLLDVEDEA